MKPVVSVVIPVYQGQKTLRRCVESLVLGVERNIQVILVDDASRDESFALCKQLAEQYPQVQCLQNPENRGVSYTRNRGIALAQGKYILFVDCDDWVSSQYIPTMLKLAQRNPDRLPICGYHFWDRRHNTRQRYCWDSGEAETVAVSPRQYITLMEKSLLQTLWNKLFRRDVIEKAKLRFDENQTMGEDFQFVLDYMEAAQVTGCVVWNQPLYYYVRHHQNSLMSRFGLTELTQEKQRIQRLYRLSRVQDPAVLDQMLCRVEKNAVYHILRKEGITSAQKREILRTQGLKQYCREQQRVLCKERLAKAKSKLTALPLRTKGWLQRKKRNAVIQKAAGQLKNRHVCLISQNCIGGVFSHDMGLPFLSPTVNLYFSGGDFVRFAAELPRYLAMEPEMYWEENYPMGKLGELTIHFMHYDNCTQAKQAWLRRAQRVVPQQVVLLCTDMEDFSAAVFEQWRQLPYPKILFTGQEAFARDENSVYFPEFPGRVEDLIPDRGFYRHGTLIQTINHVLS